MGVPKLYRFISERFPLINRDLSSPDINKNNSAATGTPIDNLYLDFNGVLHHCTHSSDDGSFSATPSEEAVARSLFSTLEHIFALVQPRQLLFLAIDGVAPRAKMNQQRQRRFLTAQSALTWVASHASSSTAGPSSSTAPAADQPAYFDSNQITPGTAFMTKVFEFLNYFITRKIRSDTLWQKLQIVLSGPNTPGEGEHKIIDYIRRSRSQPDYNPNTRHCLYGLDADLIMLALATHEPHFCILREKVVFRKESVSSRGTSNKFTRTQDYYTLEIGLLRDYLIREFKVKPDDDPERLIDDAVFLLFFCGNDFLPNLPALDLFRGGMEVVFTTYKTLRAEWPAATYLVDAAKGSYSRKRLQQLLLALVTSREIPYFASKAKELLAVNKQQPESGDATKNESEAQQASASEAEEAKSESASKPQDAETSTPTPTPSSSSSSSPSSSSSSSEETTSSKNEVDQASTMLKSMLQISEPASSTAQTEELKSLLKINETSESSTPQEASSSTTVPPLAIPTEASTEASPALPPLSPREVKYRLHYAKRFGLDESVRDEIENICVNYLEGLLWTLRYYYHGCPSWNWFYRFHAGPLLSDLVAHLPKATLKPLVLGEPWTPMMQLLAVLPPASRQFLPESYQSLSSAEADANGVLSPLAEFFPTEIEYLEDEYNRAYKRIPLIPFIDQEKLMATCKDLPLTELETTRNQSEPATVYAFDAKASIDVQPPVEGFLPLTRYPVGKRSLQLPAFTAENRFQPRLLPGTLSGSKAVEVGWPSLNIVASTPILEKAKIKIFESFVIKPTLMLRMDFPFYANVLKKLPTPEERLIKLGSAMVGSYVRVDFPYNYVGRVLGISSQHGGCFRLPDPNAKKCVMSKAWSAHWKWDNAAASMTDFYKYKRGIHLVAPDDPTAELIIAHVAMESERIVEYPVCTLSSCPAPVNHRPKIKAKDIVFFTNRSDPSFGSLALVRELPSQNSAKVSFAVPPLQTLRDESNFARRVATLINQEEYLSIQEVIRRPKSINSQLVLSRLSGAVTTSGSNGKQFEIGLGLKLTRKNLQLPGFTRWTVPPRSFKGNWEFSARAVTLIHEFVQAWPTIIAAVTAEPELEVYPLRNFLKAPIPEDPAELATAEQQFLDAYFSWLSQYGPPKSLQFVASGTLMLHPNTLREIDSLPPPTSGIYDAFSEEVITVPVSSLLGLNAPKYVSETQLKPGDRCIYRLSTGPVAPGLHGTIISRYGKLVEVLFDSSFLAGTTLDQTLSKPRGVVLSVDSLIPLSLEDLSRSTSVAPKVNPKQAAKPQASSKNRNVFAMLNDSDSDSGDDEDN